MTASCLLGHAIAQETTTDAASQARPGEGGQAEARTGDSLRELLVEKRDTLRQLVETKTSEFKNGTVSIVEVQKDRLALLDAELSLADTREDRMAILEKMLAEAKRLEGAESEMHKRELRPLSDVLSAKVLRLDIQIRAEEERRSQAEPKR